MKFAPIKYHHKVLLGTQSNDQLISWKEIEFLLNTIPLTISISLESYKAPGTIGHRLHPKNKWQIWSEVELQERRRISKWLVKNSLL